MSEWEPYRDRTATPYFDWLYLRQGRGGQQGGVALASLQSCVPGFWYTQAAAPDVPPALENLEVPLPDFARRPSDAPAPPAPPDPSCLTQPKAGMAIIGIIDAALAPGHARFCHADGTTRFLSSWQQDAVWKQGPGDKPFGREVWEDEINAAILRHTHGGVLDEDALNADLGLFELHHAAGNREMMPEVSHGCHVLDTAAGYDPLDAAAMVEAALRPIISVTLPSRKHIGAAGTFLEYFVVAAIDHIVTQAKAFVARDPKCDGLPIVINLSYGVQAGPKDGSGMVERYMAEVSAAAAPDMPVHFVLAAGNENLDQLCAKKDMAAKDRFTLNWHVSPEDHTDNYVEIHASALAGSDMPVTGDLPLTFALRLPDGRHFNPPVGKDGHLFSLGVGPGAPVGRLYCDLVGSSCDRVRYVIALCSTYDRAGGQTAPPGVYQITMKAAAPMTLDFSIQSDQSIGAGFKTGLRSKFEEPSYRRYDDEGRMVDTPNPSDPPSLCPVRRFGTVNAIATSAAPTSHVVGGHRALDGKPAPYSSAAMDGQGGLVDASFPTDDSPGRGGILAAGSRSGGVVAMRGTSFAAAQATRWVAQALADGGAVNLPAAAAANDPLAADFAPEKIGAGRMPRMGARSIPR